MDRHLDGVYFRVKRKGKWENVCFSDLTEAEQDKALERWDAGSAKRLCKILARTLKDIGEKFEIVGAIEEEE